MSGNMSEWSENVVGAFWKKGDENKYLSGYVEIDGKKVPIIVFRNKFKKEKKQPDFVIYQTFERK
jgi:uncharacterized radical SAM superfamily protein